MKRQTKVQKLATHIPGFDHISVGGLPKGRTTLFAGSAGSAKTVLGSQFLFEGIKRGENGVFVTFEETANDLRRNLLSFGWDVAQLEEEGKWAFVDASPKPFEELVEAGDYNLDGLMTRIREAIKRIGAKRLTMDSLGAIFNQLTDSRVIRRELFNIVASLNEMGVTSILTAERLHEYGEIARWGVEEFVADNVIILRNILEEEKRRRTIEILKFRGTTHLKGEFPFTVLPQSGVEVIPLSAIELKQKSSDNRITSGNGEMDRMCGGGFFRDSIILVSGATGTGKTLLATEFLSGGAKAGEKSLLFAFEESREQFFRNAKGWGMDFNRLEKEGKLKVICVYPEVLGLEDHLVSMRRVIEEFQPARIAVDSLSALERVSTLRSFREFVIGLTSYIKFKEVAGLFTATTPTLAGGTSVTEAHISTITDSIILLRYVETYGEMRRGLTVLKMRGSKHDKEIREFKIDADGMHIEKPFRNITGILAGQPQHKPGTELEELGTLFQEKD